MAESRGSQQTASSPPAANRRRLTRRDWQDIRRATATARLDDQIYSVEMHGVRTIFVRDLNSSYTLQRQQQPGSQQQHTPQQEEEPQGAPRDSLPAGNRRIL